MQREHKARANSFIAFIHKQFDNEAEQVKVCMQHTLYEQ